MPHNARKLKNIKPLAQPADSLAPAIVEVKGGDGGAIGDGGVTGATEENIERRWCDCEEWFLKRDGKILFVCYEAPWFMVPQNCRCKAREGHLP